MSRLLAGNDSMWPFPCFMYGLTLCIDEFTDAEPQGAHFGFLPLKRCCSSVPGWQTSAEAGAASTHPSLQATRPGSVTVSKAAAHLPACQEHAPALR